MPRERKFTEDEVREIRSNPKKLTQREQAKVYKCSQQAIWRIMSGKSYKDVSNGVESHKRF